MRNRNPDFGSPATPRDLITMVNHSLRCFGFGLASVTPVIGLPIAFAFASFDNHLVRVADFIFALLLCGVSLTFSLGAAWHYQQARKFAKGHWNPARAQMIWGEVLSSIGVLQTLMTLVFLIATLMGLVNFA